MPAVDGGRGPDVTVVVITRNRVMSLARTLDQLVGLAEQPPVMVVDNASADGTVDMVRERFPQISLVTLGRNHGAIARNLGVALATTDLVAFSDDDSWWAPRALTRATEIFQQAPGVGLVAGRVLVGPERTLDPVSAAMEWDPTIEGVPGRPIVLGFMACGAVVRRAAFASVGGFDDLLAFVGEEETFALDMASKGWELVYAPEVVAVHEPASTGRNPRARRRREIRNRVLSAVTRRSWGTVGKVASEVAIAAIDNPSVRAGMVDAVRLLPRAVSDRRPVPGLVEAAKQDLERQIG